VTHDKKILLYKIFALIFVVFFLFLSGDGVKNPEINHRSLCIVMGIDRQEEKICASVQIIVPEPQGQGKQMVVTETGRTLSDALDRINISIGQKVELGHCGLIILGNEYVKESVFPELMYLISSGRTSPDVNLVVSKDMEAREVLSKLNDLSKIVSEGINNIVAYADSGVHVIRKGNLSFLSDSFMAGKSSSIPCIVLGTDKYGGEGGSEENKNGGGASSENKQSQSSSGGGSSGQTVIKSVDTLALFKDGSLKGVLDADGTRGMAWLHKNSKTGLVLLKDLKTKEKTIDFLSCKIVGKKVKVKAFFREGKPIFKVKMSVKISIDDKYKVVDIVEGDKQNLYDSVKEGVINLVKEQVGRGIEQTKTLDCDAFCINELFNKFRHKEFTLYGDVLKDLEVEYDIKVSIL